MPTLHPQAKFDPIPLDLDLAALVDRTPNFEWVRRVSAAQIRNLGPQQFEKLVLIHVILAGKPLVIEKWNDRLPKSMFSAKWLEETYNKKEERVRDIVGQTDIPMTMGHYLRSMKQLTNQWTPANFRDERRQRLYLKDIDCPPEWQDRLQKVIPPNVFYMNENIEERPGRRHGDDFDMYEEEHTAAPAGDLMSSLPEHMRAQNLMCYVGHEGTYTPAHKEMCASLGQNIMVDASGDENGEKPGSSIWFMTETGDREVVREYFMSMLGHDIEIEKHFAQINAWKKANFKVYVVEQKVGDFILIPPLAPHQVWNRGTRTIKVAWNRTTAETLAMALHEALPKARIVCRDEQYKNKAIIFYTLEKYYKLMLDAEQTADLGLLTFGQDLVKNSDRMKQIIADFKSLFALYTEILVDEMFATKENDVEYIEFDSNITCSYCRANIFNRFLTCKHCVRTLINGDEDTYDICMECYAMGRSCVCVSNLNWCEQWHWADLVEKYEDWRALIIKNDGFVDFENSPLPLELARKKSRKKAVAQICQEQLRRRPFKDITAVDKPSEEPEPSPEPEIDDNGRPKKKKKKRKPKKGEVYRCHVCCHKEYTYKLAFCSTPGCTEAYCYGVLYRAFDSMPQEVMQNERWQCPKCLDICNCGACRRAGHGNPYIPKNTLLGHDTRPVADDRSIESLIDFRVHNLSWLKNVGEDSRDLSSKRMQRLQKAAAADKANGADMAGEVPALPDKELAESMDAAMQQQANGYGDQGEVLGQAANEYGLPMRSGQLNQQHGDGERVAEVADMSLGEVQSAYPDPSTFGHERIAGMGYYEQDDNASDRILFDPYQMPTAESLAAVEEEEPQMMSEYFKKQMRLAKRRARHEDDNDPDFEAPRSHHRKKIKLDNPPVDGQQEALDNMDPALFDQTMTDAPAGEADADGEREPTPEGERRSESQNPEEHRPYSPNRPTLRHARPKISYLDVENGEAEFNEVFIPRSERPPEGIEDFDPEIANKDPLDLASAAIQAISSTPTTPAPTTGEVQSLKKRRGRPPSNPTGRRKSSASNGTAGTPPGTGRRRGRPPRSSLATAFNVDNEGGSDGDNARSVTDLDAQLAQQLEGFDDDGEVITHPSLHDEEPKSAASATAPLRKRGRSPKVSTPIQPSVEVDEPRPALMSMAERMRLKGKKIKIGERKKAGRTSSGTAGDVSASPSTPAEKTAPAPKKRGRPSLAAQKAKSVSLEEDDHDDDFNPAAEEEPDSEVEEERAPSPPPAPAQQAVEDDGNNSDDSDPFRSPPPPPRQQKKTQPQKQPSVVSVPSEAAPSPTPDHSSPAEEFYSPARSPSPMEEEEEEPPISRLPPKSPTPVRIPSPPPPPPKPAGPTIVRLMSSDEEDSYSEYSESDEGSIAPEPEEERSSSDSDSDDEDIPAVTKQPAPGPTRGAGTRMLAGAGSRMAVRGGGRGRGRGG